MSEVPFSKLMWERERDTDASAMESCVKLYTWINHTVLMLLFQIFWKVSQITDYFNGKSIEESKSEPFSPLTKASKDRRHIRSMSDVQCSTPYRLPFRSKIGNHALTYDSDTRARRIRAYNIERQSDSTDSDSSCLEAMKQRSIEINILKHTDSMRIL